MTLEKFTLNNELVLITGGGGLLGRQHAEAIAEIGGVPVVLDIAKTKAAETATYLKKVCTSEVFYYKVDITDEEALNRVLGEIKKDAGRTPYGLINNAGIDPKFDQDSGKTPKSRLENFPLEQWNKEIRVSLAGAFLCSKIFGTEMCKHGRGVIINISSDLGIIAPDQRIYKKEGVPEDMQDVKPVTYSVIKHGIIGLTKYLATYWANCGIRCNALAPGGAFNNHSDEFIEKLTSHIPLGRMARIDEYKSAIQFLVSDASSYMTGQTLILDGGRSIW